MSDLVGKKLGDYRVAEPIGAGGMGEVYLAEHVHLRKEYALKVLPRELAADAEFVARFHDEARVMADLRHPHIVRVHHMGIDDGLYFLVMDYVTGPEGTPESLHDRLKKQTDGRLPQKQVFEWVVQIAGALASAHEQGVVHRDLKPANILIDADGNAKLTDFGLAKAIGNRYILSQIHQTLQHSMDSQATIPAVGSDGGSGGSARSGRASSIVGTYDYMSPEQRGEGGDEIDQRTDLYSFGVVLYRLLTGRRPRGLAKPPSEVVDGISKLWDPVVSRCLADDPRDRYASARELLDALHYIGRKKGWQTPAVRSSYRSTAAAITVLLVATVIAALFGLKLHNEKQEAQATVVYRQAERRADDHDYDGALELLQDLERDYRGTTFHARVAKTRALWSGQREQYLADASMAVEEAQRLEEQDNYGAAIRALQEASNRYSYAPLASTIPNAIDRVTKEQSRIGGLLTEAAEKKRRAEDCLEKKNYAGAIEASNEALQNVDQILKLKPQDQAALEFKSSLGVLCKRACAERDRDEAYRTHSALAEKTLSEGKWDDAIKAADQALQRRDREEARRLRDEARYRKELAAGIAHAGKGRMEEAIAAFNRALSVRDDGAEALSRLKEAEAQLDKWNGASAKITQAGKKKKEGTLVALQQALDLYRQARPDARDPAEVDRMIDRTRQLIEFKERTRATGQARKASEGGCGSVEGRAGQSDRCGPQDARIQIIVMTSDLPKGYKLESAHLKLNGEEEHLERTDGGCGCVRIVKAGIHEISFTGQFQNPQKTIQKCFKSQSFKFSPGSTTKVYIEFHVQEMAGLGASTSIYATIKARKK